MILLANADISKFYSPHTEFKDSLDSTAQGRAFDRQMLNAAVDAYLKNNDQSLMDSYAYKTFMYVMKNHADSITTVYDKAGMTGSGRYDEPFSEIRWEICDSSKTILGYECIMATTDYHGRTWTAWFSPEISVHDGPWKLCGLPGLILEASEPSGQHTFTADGIEKSGQPIRPVFGEKKYDRMNRRQMLKDLRNYRNNSNAMVKASIGLDLGKDAPAQTEYDFLETDYRL